MAKLSDPITILKGIGPTKAKQFGFYTAAKGGKKLVCLGDEPCADCCRDIAKGADWLLCEAFCLAADSDRFKPYEKHHSTALDAAQLAEQLGVKNLVIWHTEDKTIANRKKNYSAEAKSAFSGNINVPDDLERIML